MSAYNPPKNQPPIFDTTQFYNQEQEKLNFPIAQGTETFGDIIINGTIIIPATPIAYLNQNNVFTGTTNTFNNIAITTGSTLTLNGTAYINQSSGSAQNILNTLRFNNQTSTKQITLFQNSGSSVATNYTISVENPSIQRYNAGSVGNHYFSTGTGVSTYTNHAIINSSGLTLLASLFMSGTGIISQTGTNQNILKSTSITDLSVSGTLTLPNGSIADSALSSNVPLKNANNTYTGTNTFNNTLTLTSTSQLVLNNTNIYQTGGFTNTMATIVFDTGQNLYFTGGFISQTTSSGINTFESISMNSNKNISFSSGSGIINQILVSSTGTNILKSTSITDLSVLGTLTLPASSIADSALSSNVPLKNANNTYTGDNTFATIKFTNSTSVQQITLYEVSPTNYAENYSITINPFTLRYNTNSTGNHVFSTGTGTTYTDVALINSSGLTMNGKVSLRGSNFLELLDSTNTIASYITQIGGILDINNFGSGAVKITSPSLDLTNTYTYIQGAELDYGSILAFLDSTQIYATDVNQNSTNFIIENQYNSSSIILRNKDATGTAVDHTFAYNAISLNAPITMGTNNNLNMQGSGRIIQASTTSTNTLNPSQFQGDITFAVGTSRIDQTGGGNGALLRQLNMLANYDIIFNSGTGKIDQSSSTGINQMGAINMNSNTNITLSGTGIIDGTSSTGQCIFNTLKFNTSTTNQQITLYENSATNLATNYTISVEGSRMRYNVNSGAAHLFSSGTGVSTYSTHASINSTGLTMANNRNIIQGGTGILSQSGTGINLMKNITLNVDNNLLQSGIGVITQSGTGTNALKGTTFSANNTHYNGSAIIQYDSTNIYNTSIGQVGTDYYITNNTGGSTFLNANIVYLLNSYTTLKGGTNVSGYNSHLPFSDGKNYISGQTIMRGGSVEITDNYLIMRNENGINLFDAEPTPNQCSVLCSYGNLRFDNYTDPLVTSGGGNIQFKTYNLTTPIPRFHTRLNINYDGIQVKRGHLEIYNDDETSYLQADQTTTTSTIKNTAVSGSMLLQTTNASSALITNINMTPTSTTIGTDLVCSGATQFNSDLTIYTSGSNYLKLSDGTSTTRQYQSSGDCVIENTKTYSGGFGDIIFSTKDTGGSGAERFRVSYNAIKTSVNIELPSTLTLPSLGQLGYKRDGSPYYPPVFPPFLPPSAFPIVLSSGVVNQVGTIMIPTGVYNVVGQFYYNVQTGGNITSEQWSISTSSSTINVDNLLTFGANTSTSGFNIVRRINTILTNTTAFDVQYYLTLFLTFSSGAYQLLYANQATYVKFYAVRIA